MSEVIDVKDVMERVQEDTELLFELFEIFLEDYVEKRKLLGEAVTNNDVEQVRAIAHGLKGATGNISAIQMHVNCKSMEEKAKDGDVSGLGENLTQLDEQFAALEKRIEELRTELGGE